MAGARVRHDACFALHGTALGAGVRTRARGGSGGARAACMIHAAPGRGGTSAARAAGVEPTDEPRERVEAQESEVRDDGPEHGLVRKASRRALLQACVGLAGLALAIPAASASEQRSWFGFNRLLENTSTDAVIRADQPILNVKLNSEELGAAREEFLKTSFVYVPVPPSELREASVEGVLRMLSTQPRAVFIACHRDSFVDHAIQSALLRELSLRRGGSSGSGSALSKRIACGLDVFQKQHQPVLDAYMQGTISDEELIKQTQWKQRNSNVPFESFLPVFWTCREFEIPLVALSPDSAMLDAVQKHGINGVPLSVAEQLVPDPKGFLGMLLEPDFEEYQNLVLSRRSSVVALQKDVSFSTSDALMQCVIDEAIAAGCVEYLRTHLDRTLVCLTGTGRVKFGMGVPYRANRLFNSMYLNSVGGTGSASGLIESQFVQQQQKANATVQARRVVSLILNATTADSGRDPRGGGAMRLQLIEDAAPPAVARPFADYLWYCNQVPSKVKARAEQWKKDKMRSQYYVRPESRLCQSCMRADAMTLLRAELYTHDSTCSPQLARCQREIQRAALPPRGRLGIAASRTLNPRLDFAGIRPDDWTLHSRRYRVPLSTGSKDFLAGRHLGVSTPHGR
ncbi:hypothetical protein FVE85_5216 [Porphyridium purpureum]|uniref:Haem-binding uptake Tiki superfamily ChaN domain-containing protein n=1 Tax=Porphyridium purpureum TaxID=35688 RepID=A0A5J4Z169_PORPP|nr:hypothetical protein FVE85_5216 [Porphyridium purpureum]|eukprot:POR1020..scf295_1